MVKIGFLGHGWIADWHFNAIQKCPGVEVKGAFSPPAPGVAEGEKGSEKGSDLYKSFIISSIASEKGSFIGCFSCF
jgi:hypothetical protein